VEGCGVEEEEVEDAGEEEDGNLGAEDSSSEDEHGYGEPPAMAGGLDTGDGDEE